VVTVLNVFESSVAGELPRPRATNNDQIVELWKNAYLHSVLEWYGNLILNMNYLNPDLESESDVESVGSLILDLTHPERPVAVVD
jgi:hypothetical protein